MVLSYCTVVGKGLEPVREDSHAATFNVSTDGPEPPRTENRCNALYFSMYSTALFALLCVTECADRVFSARVRGLNKPCELNRKQKKQS